jgi:hypothetical protein
MSSKLSVDRPTTDNLIYMTMVKAIRLLPEGILTIKHLKDLFGHLLTDGQCMQFLKSQKHLTFEISSTGEVTPRFTKWEVIQHLKKKYLKHRRKYICLGPIDPKGVL